MFGYSISALALTTVLATATANAHAALLKRCGGCSGLYGGYGGLYGGYSGLYGGYNGQYGGYGGFGFPFASSVTTDFDRNANRAHFNDDTLYVNNVNANVANDNVHAFTNANVVA
ncbi:hypothetical protein H4R26_005499 [Coemansia thaxteri]|uniref:Uncharacterized protein n=1 Tax=Coemansia thaxteri TaxID=2663907 RepID=A0A9W8BFJ0_9FUNG|nr:hypothetical protein H4R26_005499 [Coemansia thaxteri]